MKFLQLILIFACFSVLLSCSKDSNLDQNDFDTVELMERFNEGLSPIAQGFVLKGSVDIVSTKQELIAFVNLKGEERKMFILQSLDLNRANKINQRFKDAQILFFKRSLVIQTKNGAVKILFHIDKDLPDVLKDIRFTKSFKGYGLGMQENFRLSYNILQDFAKLESIYDVFKESSALRNVGVINRSGTGSIVLGINVQCKCCLADDFESSACKHILNDDCDAGGIGASSCSLTTGGESCTITCSEGTPCCWEAIEDDSNDDGNGVEGNN